jgi:hypothetical protein
MKRWETIAGNFSNAGWSLGYVPAVDSQALKIREIGMPAPMQL